VAALLRSAFEPEVFRCLGAILGNTCDGWMQVLFRRCGSGIGPSCQYLSLED
jgi:hypothetical protein